MNRRISEIVTRVRTTRTIDRRHQDASANELATGVAAADAPVRAPAGERGMPSAGHHTPGPWSVRDRWNDTYEVIAFVPTPGSTPGQSDTLLVLAAHDTDIYADGRGGHALANARLAAAAPEMLAALKRVREAGLVCSAPIGAPGSEARARWVEQVRLMDDIAAAIRRAEGGVA